MVGDMYATLGHCSAGTIWERLQQEAEDYGRTPSIPTYLQYEGT